jgi:hypothetical protein
MSKVVAALPVKVSELEVVRKGQILQISHSPLFNRFLEKQEKPEKTMSL